MVEYYILNCTKSFSCTRTKPDSEYQAYFFIIFITIESIGFVNNSICFYIFSKLDDSQILRYLKLYSLGSLYTNVNGLIGWIIYFSQNTEVYFLNEVFYVTTYQIMYYVAFWGASAWVIMYTYAAYMVSLILTYYTRRKLSIF